MIVARAIWLIAELALAALTFPVVRDRSRWLQVGCRRLLRLFDLHLLIRGQMPTRGIVVSNHLSYLDILVFGALLPATFVAKRDVRFWLVFGWFARLAGTVFVDRERRLRTGTSCEQISAALSQGKLVVLFPEGTSSGGETVLPFKSALLSPAVTLNSPVTAACIQYQLPSGNVSEDVCYWRDMVFVPHLLKLLGKRGVAASVSFSQIEHSDSDRKALARRARSEVLRLREMCKDAVSCTTNS